MINGRSKQQRPFNIMVFEVEEAYSVGNLKKDLINLKTKNDYQQYLKNFGFDCNFNLLPNLVRLWRFRDDQLSKVFLGPPSHEGYDLFYVTEMHICMFTFLASIKYWSNDIGIKS